MKIAVLGRGVLADAVANGCSYHFSVVRSIMVGVDVIWCCHPTETGPNGAPNIPGVIQTIVKALRPAPKNSLVFVSSQLRLGTTKALEIMRKDLRFVYVPENVRVATAREDFREQARIVVGRRGTEDDNTIGVILDPFTDYILWTDPETAELSKSCMNALLALLVTFGNEVGVLAGAVRADAGIITAAMLSDARIREGNLPLVPGPAPSDHLKRELFNLDAVCRDYRVELPLIQTIAKSNSR